jgi:hypothetical protein
LLEKGLEHPVNLRRRARLLKGDRAKGCKLALLLPSFLRELAPMRSFNNASKSLCSSPA